MERAEDIYSRIRPAARMRDLREPWDRRMPEFRRFCALDAVSAKGSCCEYMVRCRFLRRLHLGNGQEIEDATQ